MTYWNTGKTQEWLDLGIDFIMGERQGGYFWDLEGKRLMDVHVNGGTFSLGHRNPEVIHAPIEATAQCDIGNHHFPSVVKAKLAKTLVETATPGMTHAIYGSSGGEIVDLALKTAHHATGRKRIISVQNCYHGHTGIAVTTGADRFAEIFLAQGTEKTNTKVPFNDFHGRGAKAKRCCLCEQYGALYIADEVQCGLMRSGKMWAIDGYGVEPDIIVTGKGLSGGIYPITAAIMNDKAAKWLKADGSAHMSTFGDSELGCCVALKVMEILQRQETIDNVADISQYLRRGLMDLQAKYSDYFTEIRQNGLIMGLGFAGDQGAVSVMRHLYDYGVWAIYSMLDPKILQFKPVILIDHSYCDELLERMDSAFYCAAKEAGFYRYS